MGLAELTELRNRVWRFLVSADDGERLPLSQAEYEALNAAPLIEYEACEPAAFVRDMKAMG